MLGKLIFCANKLLVKALAGAGRGCSHPWRAARGAARAAGAGVGRRLRQTGRQCNEKLRMLTILSAKLVAAVERNELQSALTILNHLSSEERVALAENMASLNAQHRSIVRSLPRFYCTFTTTTDGSKSLQSVHLQDAYCESAVRTIWFRS